MYSSQWAAIMTSGGRLDPAEHQYTLDLYTQSSSTLSLAVSLLHKDIIVIQFIRLIMSSHELPATMKAWQYSTGKGGLEKNLTLNTTAPLPKQKSDQYLVKTIAAALNPGRLQMLALCFIALTDVCLPPKSRL